MTVLITDLRNTRESARELRFEPTAGIDQTNVQKAIEQVSTQVPSINATTITVADSPYVPPASVTVLYADTAGGPITINLTAAALRNAKSLTIKDSTGHANANPITINPSGVETIETLATLPINADFGGVRLNPVSGTGYLTAP